MVRTPHEVQRLRAILNPDKEALVSGIPHLWRFIQKPIRRIHDYLDPIPEDEEYALQRRSRDKLYANMYSHLENDMYTPTDSVNVIKKNIPQGVPQTHKVLSEKDQNSLNHHHWNDFLDNNLV